MVKSIVGGFMDTFWRLLEESVIVQSTVTLIAIVVTAYMICTGQETPKEWWTVLGIIVGFWFGTKQAAMVNKVARTVRREDC